MFEHVQAREGDGKPWNIRSCMRWFTCIVKWINKSLWIKL